MEGDEYEEQLLGDPNQLDDLIEARDLDPLEDQEEGENVEDNVENEEGDEGDKKGKPKRVRVLNPQPKLDAERLTGPRGVAKIETLFSDFKFYGHGYEAQDLKRIMERLELWGNRLFPKMQFDDLLIKIEKLGHNRKVMNYVTRIRMGIETEDSVAEKEDDEGVVDLVTADLNDDRQRNSLPNEDIFNQLLEQQQSQVITQEMDYGGSSLNTQAALTDDQKERMMRNRLLAEERRLARIKAQMEKNSESNTPPDTQASVTSLENIVGTSSVSCDEVNLMNGDGQVDKKMEKSESGVEIQKIHEGVGETIQSSEKQKTVIEIPHSSQTADIFRAARCVEKNEEWFENGEEEMEVVDSSDTVDLRNSPDEEFAEKQESKESEKKLFGFRSINSAEGITEFGDSEVLHDTGDKHCSKDMELADASHRLRENENLGNTDQIVTSTENGEIQECS